MLELITDRTQQDVDRLKELIRKGWENLSPAERIEWSVSVQKGAYNYDDLNRVENAVADLASRMNRKGFAVNIQPTREWMNTDIPTQSDMERFLSNVRAIRNFGQMYSTTPEVPATMDNLTYSDANAIEQILADADSIISNIPDVV